MICALGEYTRAKDCHAKMTPSPPQVGIKLSMVTGACGGLAHAFVYWTYALAFLYGEEGGGSWAPVLQCCCFLLRLQSAGL